MEVAPIVDDGKARTNVYLFNLWSYDEVQVSDLSVEDNITATASEHPKFMPHSAGRYQSRRFRKEIQLEGTTKLERITCYRRRPELSNRFTRSVLR